MSDQSKQFLRKISTLSEELQFFYESLFLSEIIKELAYKYKVSADDLNDLLIDIVINDFSFTDLDEKILKYLKIDKVKLKDVVIDFLGMCFLPIDVYLEDIDIDREIKKRYGHVEKYHDYVERFLSEVEDEQLDTLGKLIETHKKVFDATEEEKVAMHLFEKQLVGILKGGTFRAVSKLNGGLIYLLFNRKDFQIKISRLLLSNQEKLTEQKITVQGKVVLPTVANWLKDFTVQKGGVLFDNLALIDFISNSLNAKLLNTEEKELLKKILIVYRNLTFFPKNFENISPEEWEIIPLAEKQGIKENLPQEKKAEDKDIYFASDIEQSNKKQIEQKSEQKPITKAQAVLDKEKKIEEKNKKITRSRDIGDMIEKYAHQDIEHPVGLLEEPIHPQEISAPKEKILLPKFKDNVILKKVENLPSKIEEVKVPEKPKEIAPVKEAVKISAPEEKKKIGFLSGKEVSNVVSQEEIEKVKDMKIQDNPVVAEDKKTISSEIDNIDFKQSEYSKPSVDTKQLMQKILIGQKEEAEKIAGFKKDISAKDGNNAKNIIFGFKQTKTLEEVIARLELLAQNNSFNDLLVAIGVKTGKISKEDFKKIVEAFLKKRTTEDQVVRYAMRLAMILKKHGYNELIHAVYFDKKDQVFKWNMES